MASDSSGPKKIICPELDAPCYGGLCPMIKEGVCQINPSIYDSSPTTKTEVEQ